MFNSSRFHLERELQDFANAIPEGAMVLDAGAGEGPYRAMFKHTQYETCDHMDFGNTTYVCDLNAIPVDDARYDYAIMSEVLEHVPDAIVVLKEVMRVLKPGGILFTTTPFFYEEHQQPYDFFRMTQYGHRYIFEKAGLEIDRLDWMEGYLGTVAYQMTSAAAYMPTRPSQIAPGIYGWIGAPFIMVSKLLFRGLAALFHRFDARKPFKDAGFPKNYLVIARRP